MAELVAIKIPNRQDVQFCSYIGGVVVNITQNLGSGYIFFEFFESGGVRVWRLLMRKYVEEYDKSELSSRLGGEVALFKAEE